jgi:hypothetical protein
MLPLYSEKNGYDTARKYFNSGAVVGGLIGTGIGLGAMKFFDIHSQNDPFPAAVMVCVSVMLGTSFAECYKRITIKYDEDLETDFHTRYFHDIVRKYLDYVLHQEYVSIKNAIIQCSDPITYEIDPQKLKLKIEDIFRYESYPIAYVHKRLKSFIEDIPSFYINLNATHNLSTNAGIINKAIEQDLAIFKSCLAMLDSYSTNNYKILLTIT